MVVVLMVSVDGSNSSSPALCAGFVHVGVSCGGGLV